MDLRLFMYNTAEIIGNVVEEGHVTLKIEKPRLLQMVMTGPSQASVSMVPWFMGNPDGTVIIQKEHIGATSVDLPSEIETGYLQQTSGLAIATGI